MRREASGEAAKAFLENWDIDPFDKLVSVVDIEDQDTYARTALRLCSVRGTDVEITFYLPLSNGGSRQTNHNEECGKAHGRDFTVPGPATSSGQGFLDMIAVESS